MISRKKVEDVWLPVVGRQRRTVHWNLTQWCNYSCQYCSQNHARRQRLEGMSRHSFDNFTPDEWVTGFRKHFQQHDLRLAITGGEPMLDQRNMESLLNGLLAFVDRIRIGTNLSWHVARWHVPEARRCVLMVSWHPSMVERDAFLKKVEQALECGWSIGMVTLVAVPELVAGLPQYSEAMAQLGVRLSVNLLNFSLRPYNQEQIEILKQFVPEKDWTYRVGIASPKGKACLLPAVGYELQPSGRINIACHANQSGSLFDDAIPALPESYVSCPHGTCFCTNKYTFLRELDVNTGLTPLEDFASRLPQYSNLSD